jgi:hypothetical protein
MSNNKKEQRDRFVGCSLNSGEQNKKGVERAQCILLPLLLLEKYGVERTRSVCFSVSQNSVCFSVSQNTFENVRGVKLLNDNNSDTSEQK